MRNLTKIIVIIAALIGLQACATDDWKRKYNMTPYVTKTGQHRFQFVTSAALPSYYPDGADVKKAHEAWAGVSLGQHRWCLNGFEFESAKNANEFEIVYEGVCK